MSEWKLVRSDALYPPEQLRAELEKLALKTLLSIDIDGERHVKVEGAYVPISKVDTETLRVLCRSKLAKYATADQLQQFQVAYGRLRSGKPGEDVAVYWRGSVRDLVTDLAPLLTVEQLQELACEMAVEWRNRSRASGGGRQGGGG